MKRFNNKTSMPVVVVILIVAVVIGTSFVVWNKNQDKGTTGPSQANTVTSSTIQAATLTVPSNFKEDTAIANDFKARNSHVSGLQYSYYVDPNTGMVITVGTRPVTDKDSKDAEAAATKEATLFAKFEFPDGTSEVAKVVAVKGDGAKGYLVQVSDQVSQAYVSYMAAANSQKIALVTVRSKQANKAQQQAVVQDLLSSLQL